MEPTLFFCTGSQTAGVFVHDPALKKCGNTYYLFGTHMSAATSTDLRSWSQIAQHCSSENPVYGRLFDSREAFFYTGKRTSIIPASGTGCWAPDVIRHEKSGLYRMYYCTSSTFCGSTLGLAVSEKIEGPYTFVANLLYSGLTRDTLPHTDVFSVVGKEEAKRYLLPDGAYDFKHWPNAIDPGVFYDKDHRLFMVYGSWSGGIFLLELSDETGLIKRPVSSCFGEDADPYFGRKLLGGGHQSIEGPYIQYEPETDYYYLYVSYGMLHQRGGYQIRVFRSRTPEGPYLDMNGACVTADGSHCHGAFGLKLSGNMKLYPKGDAIMAPGHNEVFTDPDSHRHFLSCHARFSGHGETHHPLIFEYLYNKEGWPCLLPAPADAATMPEPVSASLLTGEFSLLTLGHDLSSDIHYPETFTLQEGKLLKEGNCLGAFTTDGDDILLTFKGTAFCGKVRLVSDAEQQRRLVIAAVGENTSLYGSSLHAFSHLS